MQITKLKKSQSKKEFAAWLAQQDDLEVIDIVSPWDCVLARWFKSIWTDKTYISVAVEYFRLIEVGNKIPLVDWQIKLSEEMFSYSNKWQKCFLTIKEVKEVFATI